MTSTTATVTRPTMRTAARPTHQAESVRSFDGAMQRIEYLAEQRKHPLDPQYSLAVGLEYLAQRVQRNLAARDLFQADVVLEQHPTPMDVRRDLVKVSVQTTGESIRAWWTVAGIEANTGHLVPSDLERGVRYFLALVGKA